MQNCTFLVLLRPIFTPKMKTAPPKGCGSRSCKGLAVVWTRIVEFFGSGAHPKSVKTYFLEITWFRPEKPFEYLISAGKTFWISVKTFFCWRSPAFGPKKTLNFWFRRKNRLNFGGDLFFFFGDHLHSAETTLEFLISAGNKLLNFWFRLEKPFELRWRPFFLFGDHQYSARKKTLEFLISAEKNLWISVKTFFLEIPNFDKKTTWI